MSRIEPRKLIPLLLVMASLCLPGLAMAHPAVTLLDASGNPVKNGLNAADKITAANGSVYMAGPAYSPKQTCGKCHDYQAATRAYHFREGVGPHGENYSDTWSSENNTGTLYKYLANAYGHLLSPGQYGAW